MVARTSSLFTFDVATKRVASELYDWNERTLNYEEAVAADSPLVFWKLNEPLGATTGADSGTLGLPLSIDPSMTTMGSNTLCGVESAMKINVGETTGFNFAVASHNAALNFGAGDFTLTALIKSSASAGAIVAKGKTNTTFGNWLFRVDAGLLGLWLYTANISTAANIFSSSIAVNDGVMHRVVARRSGSAISVIQDQTTVASGTFSDTLVNDLSKVGVGCIDWAAGSNPGSSAMLGVIDAVAIWDRALTDAQLAVHYATLQ